MHFRQHYQGYQQQHPRGLAGLSGLLRAGSSVRYSANVYTGGNPVYGLESALRQAAASKMAQVSSFDQTSSGAYDLNIVAFVTTNIDRGSESDLKSDLDNAIQSMGLSVRASAIQVVNANIPPGTTPPPGQVGTGTDTGDTYHNQDTILGNAGQFWFEAIGAQLQGAVKALGEGSPLMWLGVAVVAYVVFLRK